MTINATDRRNSPSLSGTLNTMQTDLDTAESEIDTLQSDLDTAESEIDTLQADVVDLQGGLPGQLINGKIATSVSSNNLTVAIKTLADADPSASDPVYVRIGSSVRSITAALSLTLAAGTNWFNLGGASHVGQDVDLFLYVFWNTTPATDTVSIGIARFPGARLYSQFNATSTNQGYVAYSGADAPQATDVCEVAGRFNATVGAAASYNWSIPATSIVIQRPIFSTRLLTWTPTLAFGAGSWSPTVQRAQYQILENSLVRIWLNSGLATTSSTDGAVLTFGGPLTGAVTATDNYYANGCLAYPGDVEAGFVTWRSSTSLFSVYRYNKANWGTAANRGFYLEMSYTFATT